MTVWIKEGTQGDLSQPMRKAHGKLAILYSSENKDLYVTRRREFASKSLYGSLHYDGNAEDIYDPGKSFTASRLRGLIGSKFDVVEYPWGYHVEYDPK
jgi:hypothetical protein